MASASKSFDAGRVLSGCLWLLNRDAFRIAGFVIAWVVTQFALSLADYAIGFTSGIGLFSLNMLTDPLFIGVFYLVALSDDRGSPANMLGETARRYLGLLGVSIASSLGVLFGLILLIIPGLALWVLWAVAVPVLLVERKNPADALRTSFTYIRPHFWAVFGVLFVYVLVFVVVVVLALLSGLMSEAGEPGIGLLLEVMVDIVLTVIGIYLVASLYRELAFTGRHDVGVFD